HKAGHDGVCGSSRAETAIGPKANASPARPLRRYWRDTCEIGISRSACCATRWWRSEHAPHVADHEGSRIDWRGFPHLQDQRILSVNAAMIRQPQPRAA